MRSGITLATLRQEVLIEARMSTTAGQAAMMPDRIRQLLNRFERDYATRFSWKSRRFEASMTIPAGTAVATLPGGMSFTMVSEVWCQSGSDWLPVAHGIGAAERSTYPSGTTGSPICRWEVQSADPQTFEVWPVSGQDEVLRFTAERAAGLMSVDSDPCVLDGDLLVLRTAAEILKPTDMKDAQDKARQAEELAFAIQTREASTAPVAVLSARPRPRLRPGLDYIPD